jgi:hypothetical protein
LGRIEASLEDPIGFERAGYCWLDMMAQRRGTLFGSEDVYRLSKAPDATTTPTDNTQQQLRQKFGPNNVIILTQQVHGNGDFFTRTSLPTSELANILEARVLNVGGDPTNPHLDVAIPAGRFQAAFGQDEQQRLERFRVDRYVSPVSYQRMVAALSQITAVPSSSNAPQQIKKKKDYRDEDDDDNDSYGKTVPEIHMDPILKEVILSTFFYPQRNSDQTLVHDAVIDDLVRTE